MHKYKSLSLLLFMGLIFSMSAKAEKTIHKDSLPEVKLSIGNVASIIEGIIYGII
jgi:hypothetical protein